MSQSNLRVDLAEEIWNIQVLVDNFLYKDPRCFKSLINAISSSCDAVILMDGEAINLRFAESCGESLKQGADRLVSSLLVVE